MVSAALFRRSSLVLIFAVLPFTDRAFAGSTVEGRIVGFHSEPLAGVQIWVEREGRTAGDYRTRTRRNGSFTEKIPRAGHYYIAVVRIQPADDFTADHVDIRDGDVWHLDYSLHTRTVMLINRRRDTRKQLAGGTWEEIVPSKKPSNQAMQRTAPRSVFPLAVVTTFNLQARALSGAVADLVSR